MLTKNDIKHIIDYFLQNDPNTLIGIQADVGEGIENCLLVEVLAEDITTLENSLFLIEKTEEEDGKILICKYLVPFDKILYISDSY